MILISIQPFAAKKLFALAATVACLSTASCFADAMYLSARSDVSVRSVRQMQRAQTVSDSRARQQATGSEANRWAANSGELTFAYQVEFNTFENAAATCIW